jgi:hypothetical protein
MRWLKRFVDPPRRVLYAAAGRRRFPLTVKQRAARQYYQRRTLITARALSGVQKMVGTFLRGTLPACDSNKWHVRRFVRYKISTAVTTSPFSTDHFEMNFCHEPVRRDARRPRWGR